MFQNQTNDNQFNFDPDEFADNLVLGNDDPNSISNRDKNDNNNYEEDESIGLKFTSADLFSNADNLGLPEFNKFQEAPSTSNNMNFNGFGNYNSANNFGGGFGPNSGASPPELAELFQSISNFSPSEIDIAPHFKPFLPELVPSIGAIDAFIKVPRPDAQMDELGLTVLDEPSIAQSNPQIMRMELREKFAVTAPGIYGDSYIGKLEKKDDKAIVSFLESIEDIHRNRPPPTMQYSNKMPELEDLMELWPDELESALRSLPLPSAEMDLTVEEYVKVICAILEIPIKGNMVESLHVLFSLFAQFEGNQYFQSQNHDK
ncbi:hypothetical protein TRFO_33572 [Tritrichomonas foetus]|uniref:Intraflagellar transport protein 46 like protein n=1 Tax=Tritrichomonas foetus TaxID=1144522 RepID=A0A1J4JQY1_9EUKA|nr:hypothetical protein TRFO_33572 [Tritrichomonas foetus]|eukprot:OHS99925.1 hypothetical protein TRFO_33572 [Tritrichomonas foetus]